MMNAAMWRDIRGEVIAAFFLAVLATASSLQPLHSNPSSSSILPTSTSTLDLPMTPVSRPFHPASSQSLHNSRKPQMFEPDMQDSRDPCPPFDTGWAWGLQWALCHGLTVGALKWAVKGAHLSLPTTLALLVARKVSPTRALLHGVAQVIGAAVATPVLLGLLPRTRPPRPPALQAAVSPVQAWGAEFLASMVVTLIMLSAHDNTSQAHAHSHAHFHSHTHTSYTSHTHSTHSSHTHGSRNKLSSPTASAGASRAARSEERGTREEPIPPFGVVVAANAGAALFVAEFAGIGLVPTRSTAVAIVTGSWTHHWVYWVGPMLGGLLGAFTHDYTGWRPPDTPVIIPKDVSRPSALSTSLASPC